MLMMNPNTTAIYEYAEFRQEARKPRRTQKAQRQEIQSCLDQLTEQGDFWSLDLIRKIAAKLVEEGSFDTYFNLKEILPAKKAGMNCSGFFITDLE